MFRRALMGSTILRSPADAPGGSPPIDPAAAPAAVTVAEPVVAPAAPVVEAVVAPAPAVDPAAAAPVVEPAKDAPVVEAAKADEPKKAEPHTATPTLLSTPKADDPAKPGDAKPAEGAAPAAAVKPTYEAFKLPEGVTQDQLSTDALTKFTDTLATNNLTQEQGQALLDQHIGAMQQFAEHTAQEQHRIFADTRKEWQEQIRADPELGGPGHKTALTGALKMIDLLVPSEKREAFDQFLAVTGAGDHPEFFRLLHNASKWLSEPVVPAKVGTPPKSNGADPSRRGLRGAYVNTEAARTK